MTDFERFAAALKLVVRLLSVAYGFIKGKVEKAQGLLWVGFALDHHDVLGHSLNQGTCCLCGQQPDGLLDFTGYLHTACNKPTSVTICRWAGKARKQKYCSCMQHLMLKGLETQTPLQGSSKISLQSWHYGAFFRHSKTRWIMKIYWQPCSCTKNNITWAPLKVNTPNIYMHVFVT